MYIIMADVFSQLYIHAVFAVKNRFSLILPEWEESLYKYTTGIVETRGHKMLSIGGMPDHIHIFFGLKPAEAISDLVFHYLWEETKKSKMQQMIISKSRGFHPINLIGRRDMVLFHIAVRIWIPYVGIF